MTSEETTLKDMQLRIKSLELSMDYIFNLTLNDITQTKDGAEFFIYFSKYFKSSAEERFKDNPEILALLSDLMEKAIIPMVTKQIQKAGIITPHPHGVSKDH